MWLFKKTKFKLIKVLEFLKVISPVGPNLTATVGKELTEKI
jgi:hypothetical protein